MCNLGLEELQNVIARFRIAAVSTIALRSGWINKLTMTTHTPIINGVEAHPLFKGAGAQ